jgi:hypothetical protein
MKIRMLLSSGLLTSAVVLGAGVAFSGGTTTSSNRLVDFDPSTHLLSAYPNGGGLTTYLHQPTTVHLIADLTRYTPPDPCRGLANAWNLTVDYDAKHDVTSTVLFEILLSAQADFQCDATITSVPGAPEPITEITPTAK